MMESAGSSMGEVGEVKPVMYRVLRSRQYVQFSLAILTRVLSTCPRLSKAPPKSSLV